MGVVCKETSIDQDHVFLHCPSHHNWGSKSSNALAGVPFNQHCKNLKDEIVFPIPSTIKVELASWCSIVGFGWNGMKDSSMNNLRVLKSFAALVILMLYFGFPDLLISFGILVGHIRFLISLGILVERQIRSCNFPPTSPRFMPLHLNFFASFACLLVIYVILILFIQN